jgi:hypothetical protein
LAEKDAGGKEKTDRHAAAEPQQKFSSQVAQNYIPAGDAELVILSGKNSHI